MSTRISIALLLLTLLGIDSCTEAPEAVYDNPKDPQNTSAPLLAPYDVQGIYVNDSLFRVVWMEENFTTEGFTVERAVKGSTVFTVLASRKKEAYERLDVSPTWIVFSMYDSTAKRSDGEYRYRVKAYRHIPGRLIESPFSKEYTVGFP